MDAPPCVAFLNTAGFASTRPETILQTGHPHAELAGDPSPGVHEIAILFHCLQFHCQIFRPLPRPRGHLGRSFGFGAIGIGSYYLLLSQLALSREMQAVIEIGHTAHPRSLGNPGQGHHRFLSQPPGHFNLPPIPFLLRARHFLRPLSAMQFFGHQALGLSRNLKHSAKGGGG
jgi:hypothetical protein